MPDAEVLRAVARVLLRVGPSRFTLADVSVESGLSPATLLQRFSSKRGLILAFARSAADDAAAPFRRAREAHESPIEALRAALAGAAEELRSRQEIANSLAVLLDDLTDDEMRAAAARHAELTEAAIRELLDEAVAAGELPATDTAALALSVQAAHNGALIQWALRGSGSFEAWLGRVLAPLLPARSLSRSATRPSPARKQRARAAGPTHE
jgi:AcrR family transcriptional regulator